MPNRKGQTATEYLIILAVVVVIALVVIGVMGGLPGMGRQSKRSASASYWESADVAIYTHAMKPSGTDVRLRNNLRNEIQVTNIYLDETDVVGSAATIASGGTHTFTAQTLNCTAGAGLSYDVAITYTDQVTSAVYNFTGDGQALETTCSQS